MNNTCCGGQRVCVWAENEDGNWETSCGNVFVLIADTPKDNGMKYCCYCGQPLAEQRYTDDLGPPLFAPVAGPDEV